MTMDRELTRVPSRNSLSLEWMLFHPGPHSRTFPLLILSAPTFPLLSRLLYLPRDTFILLKLTLRLYNCISLGLRAEFLNKNFNQANFVILLAQFNSIDTTFACDVHCTGWQGKLLGLMN
jgi:hypothetical protein